MTTIQIAAAVGLARKKSRLDLPLIPDADADTIQDAVAIFLFFMYHGDYSLSLLC